MARDVYELTNTYPKEEQFGIISQMRRSAVSIASNIAEGAARQGTREFVQFLHIAVGSANELDVQFEISKATNMAKATPLYAVQKRAIKVIMSFHDLIPALKARAK